MAGWFYIESGGAVGPLSRIELEARVRAGAISPDTLVCEDGDGEWRLARRVPGLIPAKRLKSWQAGVAAATRRDMRQQMTPPPVPARAPAGEPNAAAGRAGSAEPGATRPVAARGADALSGARRHAGLAAIVAGAAILGAVLGSMLVLRVARPGAGPVAAATASERGATSSEPATAPAAAAEVPVPDDDPRPVRARPAGPPPLPQPVLDALAARAGAVTAERGELATAVEAFLSGGGFDAATLGSREAITARMDQAAALRDRNESLRRALSGLPEQVRSDALGASQPVEVADAAARRARADVAPLARACNAEAEMLVAGLEALGVLEESFGTWRADASARTVAFTEGSGDEPARRYGELVARAQEIASR